MTKVTIEADLVINQRYGGADAATLLPADERGAVISTQLAHRSVRAFVDEPVDEATLATIIAAAQSAPTSSNLQTWSVVIITDPAQKAAAARLCGDQRSIHEAPAFLVWLADLGRLQRLADARQAPLHGADHLEAGVLGLVDAALAAQNASLAAESLGLGTVFIGAARNNPEQLAALLELPPRVFAAFGLAIGHPDPERPADVKPRLPSAAVVHRDRYRHDTDDDIALYEERIGAFYADQGMAHSWIDRVLARLASAESLNGRDRLAAQLRSLGMPLH